MENPTIKPEIAPFKHLCMSIGAIPTSFQDSMDYYECVLWLIKYLENTVIPVVNNNGQAVAELQELYITLKNYVENYFENLDVQNEVNNKLDEMAESGELQEIIETFLNSNSIRFFDNVSLMKADTSLIENSCVKTLGFHIIDDNGGALYKVRAIEENETPNEIDSIALQNDLVADLIIINSPNIKQFGAYGDNLHDDSIPIQAAINRNINIVAPSGEYLINTAITFENKSFKTYDFSNANFNYTGNDYAFIFTKLRHCDFKFNRIKSLTGGGIYFYGDTTSDWSAYDDIHFKEIQVLSDCIHVENRGNTFINDIHLFEGAFNSGENGLYISQNSTQGCSHWVFYGIHPEGTDWGFNLTCGETAEQNDKGIDNFEFYGCRIDEQEHLFKTRGLVRNLLWNGGNRVLGRRLNLDSKANYWELIHPSMTSYVYKGVLYERSINKINDVVWQGNFINDSTKVEITNDFAMINLVFMATTEQTLTHNTVIAKGFPRPKENIYFIAQNFNKYNEVQPRLYIDTYGKLMAGWPNNAKIYTSGTPCLANVTYPIKDLERYPEPEYNE